MSFKYKTHCAEGTCDVNHSCPVATENNILNANLYRSTLHKLINIKQTQVILQDLLTKKTTDMYSNISPIYPSLSCSTGIVMVTRKVTLSVDGTICLMHSPYNTILQMLVSCASYHYVLSAICLNLLFPDCVLIQNVLKV